jgi:two-component system, OmpR family, sensor histidine kinase KdpD
MQERTAAYASAGIVGALVLGMALTPLRELTPVCNLAFVFVALVIVVAELGGRAPAVVTALASALCLDFFLTEPYLRLTIAKTEDVIAFFGLAVCGLVAAAFGSRREAQARAEETVREHLDLLREALRQVEAAEPALDRLLSEASRRLGVAAVLRDPEGRLLVASPPEAASRPEPTAPLNPDTIMVRDAATSLGDRGGFRLPPGGGRVTLGVKGASLGTLDLWDEGTGLEPWARRALADVARVLSLPRALRPRGA